jgi:hypothetical protein
MIKNKNNSFPNSDAVFLGWQETLSGDVFALYNITAKSHLYYGSTVTDKTLRNLHLQIPKQHRPCGKIKSEE